VTQEKGRWERKVCEAPSFKRKGCQEQEMSRATGSGESGDIRKGCQDKEMSLGKGQTKRWHQNTLLETSTLRLVLSVLVRYCVKKRVMNCHDE